MWSVPPQNQNWPKLTSGLEGPTDRDSQSPSSKVGYKCPVNIFRIKKISRRMKGSQMDWEGASMIHLKCLSCVMLWDLPLALKESKSCVKSWIPGFNFPVTMTSEAALIYYWHLRCDKGNVAQNKKWVANGIFWSPMYWGFIVNAANSSTIFTFRLLSSHSTTSSISSTLWCFKPYKPYIFIQTIWPPQSPRPPWPPTQLDHGETPEVWQKNINQHHSASISINQHYSALISNNQYQSASISINQKKSASICNKHELI